jgi:hypothetical protein
MRRLLQQTLILGLLCFGVSGCGGPRYGYYDSPGYGYAPYSYGWRGYRPAFADHHSWEDHHLHGHPGAFGGHMGGFRGGHGFGGHGGGGHGGGGHR